MSIFSLPTAHSSISLACGLLSGDVYETASRETAKHAAQREIFEEIGLPIPVGKLEAVEIFAMKEDKCRRGSDHHRRHPFQISDECWLKTVISPFLRTTCRAILSGRHSARIRRSLKTTITLRRIVDFFSEALLRESRLAS